MPCGMLQAQGLPYSQAGQEPWRQLSQETQWLICLPCLSSISLSRNAESFPCSRAESASLTQPCSCAGTFLTHSASPWDGQGLDPLFIRMKQGPPKASPKRDWRLREQERKAGGAKSASQKNQQDLCLSAPLFRGMKLLMHFPFYCIALGCNFLCNSETQKHCITGFNGI